MRGGVLKASETKLLSKPKQQHQVKKSKKPKSSGSSSGPKGKHQQFYYEELSGNIHKPRGQLRGREGC